jgi:hypothetical protein
MALKAYKQWPDLFEPGIDYLYEKGETERCPDDVYVTLLAMLLTAKDYHKKSGRRGPEILPLDWDEWGTCRWYVGSVAIKLLWDRLNFWVKVPDDGKEWDDIAPDGGTWVDVTEEGGPWWDYLTERLPGLVEQFREGLASRKRWKRLEKIRVAAQVRAAAKAEEKRRKELLQRAREGFEKHCREGDDARG